jgi:hypothetical protein
MSTAYSIFNKTLSFHIKSENPTKQGTLRTMTLLLSCPGTFNVSKTEGSNALESQRAISLNSLFSEQATTELDSSEQTNKSISTCQSLSGLRIDFFEHAMFTYAFHVHFTFAPFFGDVPTFKWPKASLLGGLVISGPSET